MKQVFIIPELTQSTSEIHALVGDEHVMAAFSSQSGARGTRMKHTLCNYWTIVIKKAVKLQRPVCSTENASGDLVKDKPKETNVLSLLSTSALQHSTTQ